MADSSGDITKFQGIVTRLHPYNLQDLGLNGVDDGNIEVSINSVITGSSGLVGTKVVVYRLSDLGAYIDFSVQPGDQVEVYGIYLSPQRISGPYLFELVGSEHYLRKIIEPNQPNPNTPSPNQPSPNQPKCTWTFRCNNNVVQRLCVDQNGNEYWTDYDNCNNHQQPCSCINGVCVSTPPSPPPKTCDQQTQQACQAQNGPVGQPYTLNGVQYQRYKDCNCEDGSCKCSQVEKQTPCSGIISGGVVDEKGMPVDNAQVSIQSEGVEWSGTTDNTGSFKSSQEFCPSKAFEAAADKQDYTSNKVDGSTDANGNAVVTIPITSESLGDVKFRGIVIKGGADETTQIISFYNFDIKITEVLDDPTKQLKVGDLAQVVASRDCQAKIDSAKDNDVVEVFGKCIPPQPNYQAHVDLGESLAEGASYYFKKINAESNLIITNVRFSKENLVYGEPVDIIATIKNAGDSECRIGRVVFSANVDYNAPIKPPDIEKDWPIGTNFAEDTPPLKSGESVDESVPWIVVPIYNIKGQHIHVKVFPDTGVGRNDYYKELNAKRNANCGFDISRDAYSFSLNDLPSSGIEFVKGLIPTLASDLIGLLSHTSGVTGLYDTVPMTLNSIPFDNVMKYAGSQLNPKGMCFGMASSSIIFYKKTDKKPIKGPTFDLLTGNKDVLSDIYNYMAKQFIYDQIELAIILNLKSKPQLNQEFEKLKAYIDNDDPMILTVWNGGSRHSVVAFDYYEIDENNKNVIVYDSNYPGLAKVATFDYNRNAFQYENSFINEMVQEPIIGFT